MTHPTPMTEPKPVLPPKRQIALDIIDAQCGRLADLADWDACWAIRAVIDATEGKFDPPGTTEDAVYRKVHKAVSEG